MLPVQASNILRQRSFPRDWHRQEQGVEPSVVEPLPDVASCRKDQPFLIMGDIQCGGGGFASLRRHAPSQDDQILRKLREPLLQIIQMVFALGQHDR